MKSNIENEQELNQVDLEKNSEITKTEYHQDGLYYVVPSSIMNSKDLSSTDKLCYAILSGLAHSNGECYPSDQYLCDKIGVSLKTIKRSIKRLTELRLISKWTDRTDMMRPKRIITVIVNIGDPNDGVKSSNNAGVKSSLIVSKDILVSKDKESSGHCCRYLFEKLKELRPKRSEPNWKQWNIDMERLIRIDKRNPNEIIKIIDWVFDTDNKFIVDCPKSLRNKYENIADHIAMETTRKTIKEKLNNDLRTKKAIELIKDYISKIDHGTLPSQLSFQFRKDGSVWHTIEKRNYPRIYENFMESLKNKDIPKHLIKRIEDVVKNME